MMTTARQLNILLVEDKEEEAMESVKLKTHIGQDGLLQIQVPVGITDQDVEVMVIYQPVTQAQKRSWSPGFFERTFGAWEGEPLVREPQGDLPEREPLE